MVGISACLIGPAGSEPEWQGIFEKRSGRSRQKADSLGHQRFHKEHEVADFLTAEHRCNQVAANARRVTAMAQPAQGGSSEQGV